MHPREDGTAPSRSRSTPPTRSTSTLPPALPLPHTTENRRTYVSPRGGRSGQRDEPRVPLEPRQRRIVPQLLRMRDLPIHRLLQLRKRPHGVILLQRNEREPVGARRRSGHHLADVRERFLRVIASARGEIHLAEREQNLLVRAAVARGFLGVVHRFVDLTELEIDLGQIRREMIRRSGSARAGA